MTQVVKEPNTTPKRHFGKKCNKCGRHVRFNNRACKCVYCTKIRSAKHKKETRYMTRYRRALKIRIINHYGGRCSCRNCPEHKRKVPIMQFLSIDHIDPRTKINRKETGTELYKRVMREKFPLIFRVLCFNCNTGRHINGGTCPHEVIT